MLSTLSLIYSVFFTSVLSSPLLPASNGLENSGQPAHDASRTRTRHSRLEEPQTAGLSEAIVSARRPKWSPWPLESASHSHKHGPTEVVIIRQTIQPLPSSPPGEGIVPPPQPTVTEAATSGAHRFGHGAIPVPKRREYREPVDSIELCIGDCADVPEATPVRIVHAAPQTRPTAPGVPGSIGSLAGADPSAAAENTPSSTPGRNPMTASTAPTSTLPLPGPTRGATTGPAGCVTTTVGQMSNPCRTDGVVTVHTATATAFRPVDCHGCASVHVVAPLWGCPMETPGMPSLTAATPYTWTSTVCQNSTAAGEAGSVSATELVWPTSSTNNLPWFTLSNWHSKH